MSPRETPIKVVHMWLSMITVMLTIVVSAGGVIWSIATFKTESTADIKAIRISVDALTKSVEKVATQTKENHEYLLLHKTAIDALTPPPPTPVFPNRFTESGIDR